MRTWEELWIWKEYICNTHDSKLNAVYNDSYKSIKNLKLEFLWKKFMIIIGIVYSKIEETLTKCHIFSKNP